MFTQNKQVTSLLLIAFFGLIGCSGENTANTPAPPPAPVLKPSVPQTPEAAVKAVVDGLKASKPVALWDAMATGQQDAFNIMIRTFASNADPEVWTQTVANLKKLEQLAETKKEFILKSPLLRSVKQIKPEELKASWDPGLKLFKTLLQSELADLDKLKTFDGREFFAGTGATILAEARALSHSLKDDPLKQIDEWTVTVEASTDRSATAVFKRGGTHADSFEMPLAVQDGKWTSDRLSLLQYGVSSRLDPLFSRFLPYCLVEWKGSYMADMKRVGTILDKLQAAKSSDDFQAVAASQLLPFVLQNGVQLAQKPKRLSELETRSQGRSKATAMVVIEGDHFADEPGLLELIKLFRQVAAEGKGMSSGPFKVEESTVLFVSPVLDADALSKKIQTGKVKKVDVRKNTILVDLPTTAASDKATADAEAAKQAGH